MFHKLLIFKNHNSVPAHKTYIQWLCPHWEEKKASLSFLPDKKASDGKKWEKAVRFFIVRPNRVGNQFYDDKPNGGCYMDWNENFSPVPQLQVHSVRILKIWSPWFYNAGSHICNDLNLIQQGLSQLYSSRNIGLSPRSW